MFKLPGNLPTRSSSIEELVDYVEWQCIQHGNISVTEVLRPIIFASDEIRISGVTDDSDRMINKLDDISVEIERRIKATKGKYPFRNNLRGYRIAVTRYDHNYWIYVYLLLSTRLDMLKDKEWRGIDGTKILEELAAVIAKEYFGERAESLIFGTAMPGGFQQKVQHICDCTGEGHSYINRNTSTPSAKDDKLDVVVWKNFNDKNRSKLLGFGQCKTGTSWDDAATIELQPGDFCSKWFRDHPISPPVKMFFSSQYFPLDDYSKSKNAGIVFDRFRILDYLPEEIGGQVFEKLVLWCKAAIHGIVNRK